MISHGFDPIAGSGARLLILGSLPGECSIKRGEYYAQPQNAFWRLMGDLFGAGLALPYAERTRCLEQSGVAVWDVCASARREGSLDAAIDAKSVAANDFAAFFAAHPQLRLIAFNGATAAKLYERLVHVFMPAHVQALPRMRLPSTSPAHAALRYSEKLAAWKPLRAATDAVVEPVFEAVHS
jgi:hypoxanthine-DNA glycosylase